jgi:sialic acid synthase SpsE
MKENFLTLIKHTFSKYSTNKVYVIGKGGSLDRISKDLLSDGVIININDSELFIPGDFCFFHNKWVVQSIKNNNARSGLYFSDYDFDNENFIKVPYYPEDQNIYESLFISKDLPKIYVSDFLFLSVSNFLNYVVEELDLELRVYFLGFDFDLDSKSPLFSNFTMHREEFTAALLKSQENIFIDLLKNKNLLKFDMFHVGEKQYSNCHIEHFIFNKNPLNNSNDYKSNLFYYSLLKEKINNGIPIIVAELTNNHLGDEYRLREMIRLSKLSGADAIKVQIRDVNTFYTSEELAKPYKSVFGVTLGDYRNGVELTSHLFDILIRECLINEIFWFISVLDKNSFDKIQKYNLPLIKLPSTISNHKNYLSHVANSFSGDVVVSTGYSSLEYEKFVLDSFFKFDRNVFLLQCTSSYPAPDDSCNISVVRYYNELKESRYPKLIPGYSSHDVGSLVSQMAISAGALMIEKHVKLGNVDWVHFDSVALDLTTQEFKLFCSDIKRAISICGDKYKKIDKRENHKYIPNEKSN